MTASRSRKTRNPESEPTAVTVEDWGHARARWIELPSGAGSVLFIPTSLPRAILGGFIPDAGISDMARKVALKGFTPDEDDVQDPDWEAFEAFRDWLIADCIKEPKVTPAFVSQVDDGEAHMPYEDRNLLWLAACHGVPAVLESRTGGLDPASLLETILGVSKFRPGAASPEPAEDGARAGGATE